MAPGLTSVFDSMPSVSDDDAELSRKPGVFARKIAHPSAQGRETLAAILRSFDLIGTARLGEAFGIDPSNVSRMKADHAERFALLIDMAGLKLVDKDGSYLTGEEASALITLAQRHLAALNARQAPQE